MTHAIGDRCDWLTIALARAFLMFLLAVAAAKVGRASLVVWKPATLWLRSLSGSFSLVCSFYALTRLPVGEVLTLVHTYPLWILVLTWFASRRAPLPFELIGVCSGLLGVILIEQPRIAGDNFAAGVALTSSLSTAIAMIGLHRLRTVDPRAIVAHFSAVASIVAGSWLLFRIVVLKMPIGPFDPWIGFMVLGVGFFGTVGQVFLTKAYAAGAPARVSVLGLTQVVFGLGFDTLIWQRSLSASTLLGTALVLGPTAWLIARSASNTRTPVSLSPSSSRVDNAEIGPLPDE